MKRKCRTCKFRLSVVDLCTLRNVTEKTESMNVFAWSVVIIPNLFFAQMRLQMEIMRALKVCMLLIFF